MLNLFLLLYQKKIKITYIKKNRYKNISKVFLIIINIDFNSKKI